VSITSPSARLAALLAPHATIGGDGMPCYTNLVLSQSFLTDDPLGWPARHSILIISH
jgi:hypothetical protein